VDRRDEKAMLNAFSATDAFDIIYDQMCYNPLDAAISVKVFQGKVKRYVMASTIEVYSHLQGKIKRPFVESDVDLLNEPIDMNHFWYAPKLAETNYGIGKRQAEAFFYKNGALPVVTVRIGHVLAGLEDFTGRLSHYVQQVKISEPLKYSEGLGKSSFINMNSISDVMCWIGEKAFLGSINIAGNGNLSALDIYQRVAKILNKSITPQPVSILMKPSELSPFDYAYPFVMDTQKAQSLGYHFSHSDEWLDELIRQHI
jgi:hypothetical protein